MTKAHNHIHYHNRMSSGDYETVAPLFYIYASADGGLDGWTSGTVRWTMLIVDISISSGHFNWTRYCCRFWGSISRHKP